jgi:hypothetical protein
MILIGCCFLLGCSESEKSSSVWLFGDDDALGVRIGTEVAENIEVGVSSVYWPDDDNDTQLYGAYALYHLPSNDEDVICTYVGAQTPLNNTYYSQVAPVVGIVFDEIFFTEYQYKNWDAKEAQEEDKIVFGIRIRF